MASDKGQLLSHVPCQFHDLTVVAFSGDQAAVDTVSRNWKSDRTTEKSSEVDNSINSSCQGILDNWRWKGKLE